MAALVKLTHPESGDTISVEADAVEMYRTQGWVPAKK